MKPSRDASALAASLSAAASIPPRLPERVVPDPANTSVPPPAPHQPDAAPEKAARKQKVPPDTVGITLRPAAALLNRYTLAAADRTRKEGRVISAQHIMLEVLERHVPKVSQ
jgi:hypothetical protein